MFRLLRNTLFCVHNACLVLRYCGLCLEVVGACFLGEVGPEGPQGVGRTQIIHSGEEAEGILLH